MEAVRQEPHEISLLYYNGNETRVSAAVEHAGKIYRPLRLEPSIAYTLQLPAGTAPYRTPMELFTQVSNVITQYGNIPSSLTAIATCFCLSTWFTDALETAPWLSITGPDAATRSRLRRILMCFCRRPLALADLNAKTFASLPPGWNFTIMISEDTIRQELFRKINAARERGVHFVDHSGRLKNPRCAVVWNGALLPHDDFATAPPELHCAFLGKSLPPFSADQEFRIAQDFQPRLLQYRFDNFHRIGHEAPDLSILNAALRDTAYSLLSTVVSGPELIKDVVNTLQEQHAAARSASWTDLNAVLVEALLFFIHDGRMHAYVGDVTRAATNILNGRGEKVKLVPKHVSARLRNVGLRTEPRDSAGFRYLFTGPFRKSVHKLAIELDVPTIQEGGVHCELCGPEFSQVKGTGNEAVV